MKEWIKTSESADPAAVRAAAVYGYASVNDVMSATINGELPAALLHPSLMLDCGQLALNGTVHAVRRKDAVCMPRAHGMLLGRCRGQCMRWCTGSASASLLR
jgi:hypothetical protein